MLLLIHPASAASEKTTLSLSPTTEDEDGVLILTHENIYSEIEKNDQLMIEFYAPWCGFCQALKPIYAMAAKTMKEKGMKARLGKIDATVEEHKPIKEEFKVGGYPQVFLAQAGLRIFARTQLFLDAGNDEKGAEALVSYIKEREPFTQKENNRMFLEVNDEKEADQLVEHIHISMESKQHRKHISVGRMVHSSQGTQQ